MQETTLRHARNPVLAAVQLLLAAALQGRMPQPGRAVMATLQAEI